jgi:hypothetical protein
VLEILADDVLEILDTHGIHPICFGLSLHLGERDWEQEIMMRTENWLIMLVPNSGSHNPPCAKRFLILIDDLYQCFEKHRLPVESMVRAAQLTRAEYFGHKLSMVKVGTDFVGVLVYERAILAFQTGELDLGKS